MFAHTFPLLFAALQVTIKREEMSRGEQRFISQFGGELGGFRELQVTVGKTLSKNFGFFVRKKPVIFPLPGIKILEDPLTSRSPMDKCPSQGQVCGCCSTGTALGSPLLEKSCR